MILVVAEHHNGQIKGSTLSCLTAAEAIKQPVHVLVVGDAVDSAVEHARAITGVEQVLYAQHACFAHPLAEDMAELLLQLVKQNQYSHVMMANTSLAKDCIPRAAALLDMGQVSDIIAIIDANTYKRPIYAGNAIATVKSIDDTQFVTVRASSFDKCQVGPEPVAQLQLVAFESTNQLTRWVSDELSQADRPELTDADIVISGGRGLKDQATFALLAEIADQLGAAMGASRAAVDAGLVPNELQVGQTGQVVAPQLYIAIGISGAIQHLAGMKDSKVIVAINNDPDAPIFQVADYGLVADLFSVLPELKQHLKRGLTC